MFEFLEPLQAISPYLYILGVVTAGLVAFMSRLLKKEWDKKDKRIEDLEAALDLQRRDHSAESRDREDKNLALVRDGSGILRDVANGLENLRDGQERMEQSIMREIAHMKE